MGAGAAAGLAHRAREKVTGESVREGKKGQLLFFFFPLSAPSLDLSFFLEKETWLHQTGEGNNSRAENGKRKRAAGMR